MYELVNRLREVADEVDNDYDVDPYNAEQRCLAILEAANAIEELSMRLHGDEAAIAGMKREIERMVVAGKPRWLPVTERLPGNGTKCLVARYDYVTKTPFVDLLWFDNSWWDRLNSGDYAVTHWMPLPEPPKEET